MTDLIAEPCPKHEGQRCPAPCHGAHRCLWDQTRQVHGPGAGGGAYPIWSADDDHPPQTALMLTQQEWGDLAFVAHHFLRDSEWVLGPEDAGSTQWPKLARRRALAERIIEANQP